MPGSLKIVAVSVSVAVLLVAGSAAYLLIGMRRDAAAAKTATVEELRDTGAKVREKLDQASDATQKGVEGVRTKYEEWKTEREFKKDSETAHPISHTPDAEADADVPEFKTSMSTRVKSAIKSATSKAKEKLSGSDGDEGKNETGGDEAP